MGHPRSDEGTAARPSRRRGRRRIEHLFDGVKHETARNAPIDATNRGRAASHDTMSALASRTRQLLPIVLLVALVIVLVLVVLPAVLAAAGGTAT